MSLPLKGRAKFSRRYGDEPGIVNTLIDFFIRTTNYL